jgi:hypothetical protein
MEKSIESIWKEGFLNNDALIAPKLNDLYNQKSTHIIDKYKRMFKINLNAIVIGSFLILGASFLVGIPIMGVGFFLILNAIVIANKKLLPGLEKIDKSVDSYHYLIAFDSWMKEQLSTNRRMARYYYPLFFLSTILGFWFSNGIQEMVKDILSGPHQIYLVNGIPVFWVLGVLFVTGLLAFFGGRIYNWDVKLVYGGVFKKLEELIADMEELRN